MDYATLEGKLKEMGVVVPDVCRAALYYDKLEAARNFFSTEMSKPVTAGQSGLGSDYDFVRPAVISPNLLTELATRLDWYVCPAVSADLERLLRNKPPDGESNNWTYKEYFKNKIFSDKKHLFDTNIVSFYSRYLITKSAIDIITANFKQNILLACQRIVADKHDVMILFSDRDYELILDRLIEIKSTGSDSHKGGKQVLILTFFGLLYDHDYKYETVVFKLVYKPSDMESDCLIVGDSAALNRVDPNFFGQAKKSLVEIFNDAVAVHPEAKATPLPTYRILPKQYMSLRPAQNYGQYVKDSYGYIEFLNHYLRWQSISDLSDMKSVSSDFVIFKQEDKNQIVEKFYRQLGQWMALACTFSFTDMHLDNIRCHKYQVYPIDLELCLIKPISDVISTVLLDVNLESSGGITGAKKMDEDIWILKSADSKGGAVLGYEGIKIGDNTNNRLYIMENNRPRLVSVDKDNLMCGYVSGMNILEMLNIKNELSNWFARLTNSLVRYVPMPTGQFINRGKMMFLFAVLDRHTVDIGEEANNAMLNFITEKYGTKADRIYPDYLSLQFNVCGHDYKNCDIPVFYHRIGTMDLVNSRGDVIEIPNTIKIKNNDAAPVGLQRSTFFPNSPTQNNVYEGQFKKLVDNYWYGEWYKNITDSIMLKLSGLGENNEGFFW
ncbi:MAG: DUF4135 domain-containing protein [Chlorobiaceae bacterium]|nr:DUF4135 domain-containing protein [Chlorobiaceae bacterium]